MKNLQLLVCGVLLLCAARANPSCSSPYNQQYCTPGASTLGGSVDLSCNCTGANTNSSYTVWQHDFENNPGDSYIVYRTISTVNALVTYNISYFNQSRQRFWAAVNITELDKMVPLDSIMVDVSGTYLSSTNDSFAELRFGYIACGVSTTSGGPIAHLPSSINEGNNTIQVEPALNVNNINSVMQQKDRAFWDLELSNASDTGFAAVLSDLQVDVGTVSVSLPRRCEAYYLRSIVGGRMADGTKGPYCTEPSLAAEVYVRTIPKLINNVTVDAFDVSKGVVDVSWSDTEDNGGCDDITYEADISRGSRIVGSVDGIPPGLGGDQITIDSTDPGSYKVCVLARSLAGISLARCAYFEIPEEEPAGLNTGALIAVCLGSIVAAGLVAWVVLKLRRRHTAAYESID
eukprot:TRINITY_DN9684_c0_g1_i1.p1 TRINITY_DN9684_c0_g1~~TRINITY_DN9684_c0_g1_i1.p1  ORF type:complete len:403 (+),score=68.41 TRINITY_DN9684_c0_g1_i1:41-1249(+)